MSSADVDVCPTCKSPLAFAKLNPQSVPKLAGFEPEQYRLCPEHGVVGRAETGPWKVLGKPVDPNAPKASASESASGSSSAPVKPSKADAKDSKPTTANTDDADVCPSCAGPLAFAKLNPDSIPKVDFEVDSYRFCPKEGLIIGMTAEGPKVIGKPIDPKAK